ncbi:MAG: translation elongation factor Ts [Candidatus Porifericomitaceae bacterium WSBS_2022_MAG_OTU9]
MTVEITSAMVKGLRERTGLGLMDCKRALKESDGDAEKAIIALRTAGLAKASAKSSREASEGIVSVAVGADGRHVMYEVNCETDFVARSDDFTNFMQHYGDSLLACTGDSADSIAGTAFVTGGSIEEARCALVAKVGENVNLRRFERMSPEDGSRIEHYVHHGRIGVMVEVKGAADSTVGREVAMHIAASQPRYIEPSQVPEAELEQERSILVAKAEQSGKPEAIVNKMVAGQIRKYCSEICLLQQAYVRDDKITVGQLLQKSGASVSRMLCYVLGGDDGSRGGRAS